MKRSGYYTLAVERSFEARHYLVGGDWGDENVEHTHHYRLELSLEGTELDRHGYLVDIVHVEELLEKHVEHYRGKLLNSLPEFANLNPSIEHFARILCESFLTLLDDSGIRAVSVRIWESDIAWTSYRIEAT